MSRLARSTDIGTIPTIVVGETDHRRLTALATAVLGRSPEVAEVLLTELDRASVVAAEMLPSNVVGMDSTIEFVIDGGETRRASLVFPGEANIDEDKISILTPIGAALIGLSPSQSFQWAGPNGRLHRLTVIAVKPTGCRCLPLLPEEGRISSLSTIATNGLARGSASLVPSAATTSGLNNQFREGDLGSSSITSGESGSDPDRRRRGAAGTARQP